MEQDQQGVCEAPDSEGKGMGSDCENSEDREGDPEERGVGSNAQDTEQRGTPLEQDVGSNPQDETLRGDSEERELVSDVCTGEDKAGVSMDVAPRTCKSNSSRVINRGSLLGRELSQRDH